VDVNLRSAFFDVMVEKAGHGLVVSLHDLGGLPEDDALESAYRAMSERGADVAKIAAMPRTLAEVGRLLTFARRVADGNGPPLLPIAMGRLGTPTRLLAGRFGAPFTFAASAAGSEAAPGQVPADAMVNLYRVRDVGPATRVYAVLQADADDALVPALHNAAFRACGLDAIAIPLETDSLESLVSALPAFELSGLSVAKPFERALVPELDDAEPATAATGRADTVVIDENGRMRGSLSGQGRGVESDSAEGLLRRAVVQFETWTGSGAPIDVMRDALRGAAGLAVAP
jgi:3-dehydroquinate dehydratase/shikimate dehydrogenase